MNRLTAQIYKDKIEYISKQGYPWVSNMGEEVILGDTITTPNAYIPLLNWLATTDLPVIRIVLCGYGGDSISMAALQYAIAQSKALVIMSVVGDCYSAHTELALSGDILEVWDKTAVLRHHWHKRGAAVPEQFVSKCAKIDKCLDDHFDRFIAHFYSLEEKEIVKNDKSRWCSRFAATLERGYAPAHRVTEEELLQLWEE